MKASMIMDGEVKSGGFFRLNTKLDTVEIIPTASINEVLRSFQDFRGQTFNTPIYAGEKDINNVEHRRFYGAPPVSAILAFLSVVMH